ncbi:MAG: hypothetical protein KDK05_27680 [Candidatus Competibacteraceae bacterium]|nr:hypothetical protein [Candidatus Competibacteraceae bacterium]
MRVFLLCLLLGTHALMFKASAAAEFEPDFSGPLSTEIPSDVDNALKNALLEQGRLQAAHRLFEKHAWQTFIALNWPLNEQGDLQPEPGAAGAPRWTTWSEIYEVFKQDGSAPDPWGQAQRTLPPLTNIELPRTEDQSLPYPDIASGAARVLHNLSSTAAFTILDEVNQAFSNALWDQNGNLVHYEVLINQEQYDYIVDNQLYHVDGQIDYLQQHGRLSFPVGQFGTTQKGAIEIKLAWKQLDPDADDPSRYLTQIAYIPSGPEQPRWVPVQMGLVGFHIAQKTAGSPQWIWSTFEHIDNVEVDMLAHARVKGESVPLRPAFNNPDCAWCAVNVPPQPDADGTRRTQVMRLISVPPATRKLNQQVQQLLAQADSKLAYYELIGVQWPTQPDKPPERGMAFPGAVVNKSGGEPFPVYLLNSVMETYVQTGNQPADRMPGAVSSRHRTVFATESCMGCHAAAPHDDFSWIMIKARAQR